MFPLLVFVLVLSVIVRRRHTISIRRVVIIRISINDSFFISSICIRVRVSIRHVHVHIISTRHVRNVIISLMLGLHISMRHSIRIRIRLTMRS